MRATKYIFWHFIAGGTSEGHVKEYGMVLRGKF